MATANKIINVADRVQRAKDFLLSQFKDKPNINAFVEVVVAELQELENSLTDLQDARTLNGSYGVFLDEIGRRLKVPRGNYEDNDYKTAIKIAMAKKTASATAEDIIYLVELLTSDTNVTLTNNYPYMVELTGYLYCLADDTSGLAALADLFPVNTRVRLIQHYGKSFKFGTAGRGFGSGSTLNNLAYYRYGDVDNPSFRISNTEVVPPALTSAPIVLVNPYVVGDNIEGSVLSVVDGEWAGDTPITFTYQWLRNNIDIGSETSATYTVTSLDLGESISCRITATNLYGESSQVTNSVLISETPAPVALLTDDIGMDNIYSTAVYIGGLQVTATSTLTISSNGTTTRSGNSVVNDQWLTTTGVGLGSDYNLSYTVVSGQPFSNLNPDALHDLTNPITFTVEVTASSSVVRTGTYDFTIRNKTNSSVNHTKRINITAEVVDENF